jgi:F-type H+-transporting ATPase subunit epsilon
MAMNVEVVSPERILYSGDAEMVTCRTVGGGDIAFLAEHAPFLGALEIGKVKVKTTEGEDVQAAVHGGFVHVRDNQVIILSDVAELAGDIDADRARKAKDAAERRDTDIDDATAEAAIARANIRLELAGK